MAEFFVSPDGNDSFSGSITAPYLTITRGIQKLLTEGAGSTLSIRAGTYDPGSEGVDSWSINNLRGTATDGITIQAYNNEAVVLSGLASGAAGGYPQNGLQSNNTNVSPWRWTYNALLTLRDCAYLTISGLTVRNSLGCCIKIDGSVNVTSANYNTAAIPSHHITLENVTVNNCRSRAIEVNHSAFIVVDGLNMYETQVNKTNGAAFANINVFDLTLKNSVIHQTRGEAFIADGNRWLSRFIKLYNNVWFDMAKAIYIHACKDFDVQRNYIYWTPQSNDANYNAPNAIKVTPMELDLGPVEGNTTACERGVVANNIIVNAPSIGIGLSSENNIGTPGPIRDVFVGHNTVVNSGSTNFFFKGGTHDGVVFKDNLSYNTAGKHVKLNGFTGDVDADYNLWSTNPTSGGSLVGNANDEVGNPLLVGLTPPTRTRNSYALIAGYDNAFNFRIGTSSPAKDAGTDLAAAVDAATAYTLTKSFDFENIGSDETAAPDRDAGAEVDMGAHEYGSATDAEPPTATATVESGASYDAEVGETVDFAGSGSGGTGALTYSWDFGDETSSTTQNPTHVYSTIGVYVVTLTVTDSVGVSDTATVVVNVFVEAGGTSVTIEMVAGAAGDASYTVTGQPKAIFAALVGGVTDDTLKDDAVLSFGVWAADGSQYSAGVWADDNQTTSNTRSSNVESFLYVPTGGANISKVAAVSSVSASAVNLTWPDNETGEFFVTANFSGAGITNPTAAEVALGAEDTTVTISGDFNFLIFPASLLAGFGASLNIGGISLGMAVRDGAQVCHSYRNRYGRNPSEMFGATWDDRVANVGLSTAYVTVDSWDASGITFRVNGTDINQSVGCLLMHIDAEIAIGTFDTPTGTGNSDITTPGLEAQIGFLWGGNIDELNSNQSDDTAGLFHLAMFDGTADYTVAIASDDAASPTDEASYYADEFKILDKDAVETGTGTLTFVTDGFRMAMSANTGGAYKWLYALIEAVAAAAQIVANFAYEADGWTEDPHIIYAGDTVNFFDLSGSAFTVDTWTWVWGDGTANGTTQNPTHVFDQAGTYSVTLTAEDTNSDTDSETKEVIVLVPEATVGFTTDPADGDGAAPLECEIDSSGVTAGTGETIARLVYLIELHIDTEEDDSEAVETAAAFRIETTPADDPVEFTITDAGTYDMVLRVYYENREDFVEYQYPEYWIVTETPPAPPLEVVSSIGFYRVPRGPQEVTLTVTDAGRTLDGSTYASIEWDPGDGTGTDANWEFTHEYQAVAVATTYDLLCTVTDNEGNEYELDVEDFITVYPPVTAPHTIDEILDHIEALRAVDYLDGAWVQEGSPNTSVWGQANAMPWADADVRVTEDGTLLTERASIALCQANPGSYYVTFSDPTLTVYVHPTGSTNPNTNGSTYRWLYD